MLYLFNIKMLLFILLYIVLVTLVCEKLGNKANGRELRGRGESKVKQVRQEGGGRNKSNLTVNAFICSK